jgi:hypothetical protein
MPPAARVSARTPVCPRSCKPNAIPTTPARPRLARLEPTVLAGGHGRPVTGDGTAEALSAYAKRARDP